jgi:hypothetical protein
LAGQSKTPRVPTLNDNAHRLVGVVRSQVTQHRRPECCAVSLSDERGIHTHPDIENSRLVGYSGDAGCYPGAAEPD